VDNLLKLKTSFPFLLILQETASAMAPPTNVFHHGTSYQEGKEPRKARTCKVSEAKAKEETRPYYTAILHVPSPLFSLSLPLHCRTLLMGHKFPFVDDDR